MKNKRQPEASSIQNIIAKGTKIVGDFFSEGDVRIDGIIEGTVKTPGRVVVGVEGVIIGTLESSNAYFEGKLSGKLTLSETLTLKSSAVIEGEVTTNKLAVEPGATFNVTCAMKSSVKAIDANGKTKKTA